ncbi:MAG: hypothetical protein CEO19_468 [Parcubacteria group bacterium Gr01-1014_73]|nr:MAG: hypothetical protein CEO19_468 [Parcubacteria group bacterium Gr01-1014_73]
MNLKKFLTLFLTAAVFLPYFSALAIPFPPNGPPDYDDPRLPPFEGNFEEVPCNKPLPEQKFTPPVTYEDLQCKKSPAQLEAEIETKERMLGRLVIQLEPAHDELIELQSELQATELECQRIEGEIRIEENKLKDPDPNIRAQAQARLNDLKPEIKVLRESLSKLRPKTIIARNKFFSLQNGVEGLQNLITYLKEQLVKATSPFCRFFNRRGLVRFPWPETKKPPLGEFLVEFNLAPEPPLTIGGIWGGAILVVPIFLEELLTAPEPAWRCLGLWGRLFCTAEERVAAEYQQWIETGCSDRFFGQTECLKEAMSRYYTWKKYLEENNLPHTNRDIGKLERAYQEVLAAMEKNRITLAEAIERDFPRIYGSLLNFFVR